MAEKVRLIMEADNTKHVKAVREVQNAHVSLNKTVVKNSKREKGLIEDIENEITKLEASKKKAYNVKSIEQYNKKIAEAKQHLKEYNETGLKAASTTESMTQKMTKWVLGIGGAMVALRALKDLFKSTTMGINAFNIAGVAARQVFSNLVSGASSLTNGLRDVISAQKELNALRLEDLKYERAAIQEMTAYKDALIQGHDQMLTTTERIKAYDSAIQHLDNSIKLQKKNVTDELEAVDKLINAQTVPEEKLLIKHARLMMRLDELDKRQSSGLNEVMSMRSGLIKKELADRQKAEEDAAKELKRLDDENTKERAAGLKAGAEADKALQKARNETRKELAEAKDGEIGIWDRIIAKTKVAFDRIDTETKEFDKREKERLKEKLDEELEMHEQQQEAILDMKAQAWDTIINSEQAIADILANILDNKYDEDIERIDKKTEKQLLAAGDDEEKKTAILEKSEEERLRVETEYSKKRKSLALAQSIIDTAAATLKAYLSQVGIPVIGPALAQKAALLAGILGALQTGIIASTKFAKGGWTGKGGYRDETGERVAGIVHEDEFVIKRGPAAKHREILEAINKDDRRALNLSMNNIPEMSISSPNVLVNSSIENSGPNSRLDSLIIENRRLNKQIANATSIQDLGTKKIVKRGSHTRIVNV